MRASSKAASSAIETRADCSRCAALCCIAYPSEDMPVFAARKDGGEPCPNLDGAGQCTIYATRAEAGFSGCIRYECFGAGQHVTQALFGGCDWRTDPSLLGPMVEAFLAMRPVSDLLFLAERAQRAGAAVDDVRDRLEAISASCDALLRAEGLARCEADIRSLYKTLDHNRI